MKLLTILLSFSLVFNCVLSKSQKKSHKKSKKSGQLGIIAGTAAPFQSEISTAPNLAGTVPQTTWNATLNPENGKNTGRHSVLQMNSLFLNRGMTHGQVKSIISVLDNNQDGSITDDEYAEFFQLFIQPFINCDTDKNNFLNAAELTACFTTQPDFPFLNQLTPTQIAKIIFQFDQATQLNFHDYIFLRRINNAVKNCGENYLINPGYLYCALAITSPRTRRIYTPDEKIMFKSAIVLSDGYYNGQQAYLTITQFIGVAHVYNYFNEYQIPFDEGFIYLDDVIKATQEQMLPFIYTPGNVRSMFYEQKRMTFFAFCLNVFAFRIQTGASILTTNRNQYTNVSFAAMATVFPQRLQFLINQSQLPNQTEIETASHTYWNQQNLSEDKYLRNYNNLVFLQKKAKVSLAKKSKNVPDQYYSLASNMAFSNGSALIFQMINTYNNQTIRLQDFLKFYKLSLLYLEFDPDGLQRLTNEVAQQNQKAFVLQSLTKSELLQFNQLLDFLQERQDFYVNYKEFLNWFFVKEVFDFMRIQGTVYQTPINQLVGGFTKLGLRLSHYAIKNSVALYDNQNNQRNINYRQTFYIAFVEELLAMRSRYAGLLNQVNIP